ncbi:MAG TPA: heme-copper oxidase subunit III [Polyangiaceae bacterium]|jgi:cytochrome c oxidase subunit 3|nr:heme-copper oxidase subunit III [Polyangiaceae bacterium]
MKLVEMLEPRSPLSRIVTTPGAPAAGGVSAKQLAMIVLFGTLSMLFGASVVGYLITRSQNDVWKTASMPGLPLGLVASTVLLAALSGAMHVALRAVRQNRFETLQRALTVALLLGLAFVVGQAENWRSMYAAAIATDARTLYAFTFYMLTGLHAAHVIGGFVPLVVVMGKAKRREYSSSNHEGVKLCLQYWDYLGVIWSILLGVLYFAT